jgi:hypothetical protein
MGFEAVAKRPGGGGDLTGGFAAVTNATRHPERASTEHEQHRRADEAEHDAEPSEAQQPCGARDAEARIGDVDDRRAGSDRRTHLPTVTEDAARTEQPDGADLGSDEEPCSEARQQCTPRGRRRHSRSVTGAAAQLT